MKAKERILGQWNKFNCWDESYLMSLFNEVLGIVKISSKHFRTLNVWRKEVENIKVNQIKV